MHESAVWDRLAKLRLLDGQIWKSCTDRRLSLDHLRLPQFFRGSLICSGNLLDFMTSDTVFAGVQSEIHCYVASYNDSLSQICCSRRGSRGSCICQVFIRQ